MLNMKGRQVIPVLCGKDITMQMATESLMQNFVPQKCFEFAFVIYFIAFHLNIFH